MGNNLVAQQTLQKILLVYPEIPTGTYWSFKHALKFIRKRSAAMPPLGLITVAALMPASIEFKLIDMNIEPLKDVDIAWADAVFISAMTIQQKSFAVVVQRCLAFHKPIVAGGPYVTVQHSSITDVNHLLLGEVENTLSLFVQDFAKQKALPLYAAAATHPDLSHTVIPRFDLLKLSSYVSMSIQYSRGCPFHCEFCDVWQIYGRTPRVKSAANVLAELDALHHLGWKGEIFIVDDNFIGNRQQVKNELLPALIEWQKKHQHRFHFYTETSVDLASDEPLLAAMRAAGFNAVFLGIETPANDSLKETRKLQNTAISMPDAIRKIQTYGMEVMGGFIIGFDHDAETIFEQQIDFIQKAAIPKAMVGLLNAVPGTQLYRRLLQENRLLTNMISGSNTHCLTTNFLTKIDPYLLKEGYKKVLDFLYGKRLKNYFARCSQLFDTLGESPFLQHSVSLRDIKTLIHSFILQSCSRYGYQYLKFMLRNFFKHRRHFAAAVRMSIEGHHFYIITRETLKMDKLATLLEERYQMIVKKINAYSTALSSNPSRKIPELQQLWRVKKTMFNRLKKKINKTHADFRTDLIKRYTDLDQQLSQLIHQALHC